MKSSKNTGLVLIVLGIAILLHNSGIDIFRWEYLSSFGAILIGFLLLQNALSNKTPRGTFWGSFFVLMGLYYFLSQIGFYEAARGLTISIVTIAVGLALLIKSVAGDRHIRKIGFGVIAILLGIFFYFEYMHILPPYMLIEGVDRYWPILLVIWGVLTIANGIVERKTIVQRTVEP